MSSHGKILDLLDDRYLNLQDVIGNAALLPKLVPYDQYNGNMIVYRMDTKHEILLGLIQDFTDRIAQSQGHEIWTWLVQWEVESPPDDIPVTPAAKKARVDQQTDVPSQSRLRKTPAYTRIERRSLRPELFEETDMLRILVDIVQVDSRVLPNYVEFLYQWIDYYEGDGKALKAALRREIPSLWEFDYRPLPLPQSTRSGNIQPKTLGEEAGGNHPLEKAAERIGEKFSRQKPDIRALEAATEDSERLKYREPRFGIQPPTDASDEPIPPLVNVPQEESAQRKYYTTCFRNRQRAFWLLQEAGVSPRQIANYRKMQDEDPRKTSENGRCGGGFTNYYHDEKYAHAFFQQKEEMAQLHAKQREIAISDRLATEARLAATIQADSQSNSSAQQNIPAPLVPSTLNFRPRPDLITKLQGKMQSLAQGRDINIRLVPKSVHGKMKSKAFKYAFAPPDWMVERRHPTQIRNWPWHSGVLKLREEAGNANDGDNGVGDDGDHVMGGTMDSEDDLPEPSIITPPVAPTNPAGPGISSFIQSLNRTQLSDLIPLLTNSAQGANLQTTPGLQPASAHQESGTTVGHHLAPLVPQQHALANADPSQLPLPANLGGGSLQPQGAHFLASAPPAITVTPPTSTVAQGQMAQNDNATRSQSTRDILPVLLQQFMVAQERLARLEQPSPTLAVPPNPASSNPRPVPAPINVPLAHLDLPSNLPTIQRQTGQPSPIPLTPLAAQLGSNLSIVSPGMDLSDGIPIQIYVPKVVLIDDLTPFTAATDCLFLGYTWPGTKTLVLSKAIFLPMSVWENTCRRVGSQHYQMLESYRHPLPRQRLMGEIEGPHKNVYDKLAQAYGFMAGCANREEELTKRWRITRGPMTATKRGAVWEGWGLWIDRPIQLGPEERKGEGVWVKNSVDGDLHKDEDEWTRRKKAEIERILEEECGDLSDEEMED